jgi:hypothetical protein
MRLVEHCSGIGKPQRLPELDPLRANHTEIIGYKPESGTEKYGFSV